MPTLYQRVLGDRFDGLSAALRRFHSAPRRAAGHGRFRVTRRPGVLGALMGLPSPGDDVPMTLRVSARDGRETWTRTLGGTPVITHQWCRDGLLMERSGPVTFGFALDVVDGGLVFRAVRVWYAVAPLPLVIAPRAEASVTPTDRGWHVGVRLSLPFLGPFLGYEGEVIPDAA